MKRILPLFLFLLALNVAAEITIDSITVEKTTLAGTNAVHVTLEVSGCTVGKTNRILTYFNLGDVFPLPRSFIVTNSVKQKVEFTTAITPYQQQALMIIQEIQ